MKTVHLKSFVWFVIYHLPDKMRYFIVYSIKRHRIPNLFRPRDYSEYICRDMLFNRNNSHAFLADKYKVREFVHEKGLSDILTQLYGVWDNANHIDFESLPDQFALKCNHSCGMNIVCENKSELDRFKTIDKLNEWLRFTHPIYFESHYKKIKPLVFCEEYITDHSGVFPMDYKIHCAHGKPVFIQVCFDRNENEPGKRVVYDLDWNDLHFSIDDTGQVVEKELSKPKNLEKMLNCASILSSDLEYARIDLYDTNDKVLFGEITLTPMGGWLSHFTQEALTFMGDRIRNTKN